MFADSFCDSAWANPSQRGWTTLASLVAQLLALGGLLVLPLLLPELPQFQWLRPELLAPPQGQTSAGEQRQVKNASASNLMSHVLRTPGSIPNAIIGLAESEVLAPPEPPPGYDVPGGTGAANARNPVIDSLGDRLNALAPPPVAQGPRTSVMMEGNHIHRVPPPYLPLALQAHIPGAVVLRAVISRQGTIENLQLISGHPLLAQPRWTPSGSGVTVHIPGQPVEVETRVTVNFVLSGG